jgi:hypothetical protein
MATPTPRQKRKALKPIIKKPGKKRDRTSKLPVGSDKHATELDGIARNLVRASDKAFKRFGLARNNPEHQLWLLHWLAFAIYGGKGPGHPRKWTTKTHDLLLEDIKRLSCEKPELKEGALCRELCSGKSKLERYAGVNPATLRRRLQDAKKANQRDIDEEVRIRALSEIL